MIPVIERLEIDNIAPFQTRNTIKLSKNGNKLLRPNGGGKTTLIESIEYSLFEEIYKRPKRIFLQKIEGEGTLKATWSFKNNKEMFGSKLFPSKTISITSSEKTEEKSNAEKITELVGYEPVLVHDAFNYLCVKRESVASDLTSSGFRKFIQIIAEKNLEASGLSELVQRRRQLAERNQHVKNKLHDINRKKNKFKEFSELFFTNVSVDDIDGEIKELEEEIIKLENELSRMQGFEKDLLLDPYFQKKIEFREEKSRFSQEIKSRKIVIDGIEKQINELTAIMSKEHLSAGKGGIEIPDGFEKCNYCSRSLDETWTAFIESDKCPACGRGLSGDKNNNIDAVDLEDLVFKLKAQLDRERAITMNFVVQQENVETELENLEKEIYGIQTKREEIATEIGFISRELLSKKGKMSTLSVLKDHYDNFDYDKLLDEEMALVKEKETLTNKILMIEDEINSKRKSRSLKNFIETGIKRFYPKKGIVEVDFSRGCISFNEPGELNTVIRDIVNLSTAERYFLDLGVRIGIQELLLYSGIIDRGLLILDSPEFALDKDRRSELAQILGTLDDFQIILTTRVESFYNALEGEEIKVVRAERSLFDYFT
ncbi:MAG: AAA family ATPase [Candidatus Hodarchaeales archaeon]